LGKSSKKPWLVYPESDTAKHGPLARAKWSRALGEVRRAGVAYGRFRTEQESGRLAGMVVPHDHPIGVIGEFWARYFYEVTLNSRTCLPETGVGGHDFRVKHGPRWTRVSVKAISDWRGENCRISLNGNSTWEALCLVHLDRNLRALRLGVAPQGDLKSKFGKPIVLEWLEPGGCIRKVWVWHGGMFMRRRSVQRRQARNRKRG
jgi:hypothetical protein